MHTPFLTALAPEARVKGSRDPLGLLPLWARVGRRGIGNVTTVSGDLRGWTQLIVSVGLAREWGYAGDPKSLTRSFLTAERLVAFARVWETEFADDAPEGGNAGEVRGVTRARMMLRDHARGEGPMPVGDLRRSSILGNQRSAGVWGQIAASAHSSQLLDRKAVRLKGKGLELWDAVYKPALREVAGPRRWSSLLVDNARFDPAGAAVRARRVATGRESRGTLREAARWATDAGTTRRAAGVQSHGRGGVATGRRKASGGGGV
jgi:hypothetical protein